MTDFNDPEQRLDYLLQHGIDAYNKAMEDPFAKTVVETVNGHSIRLVHTMRFGALYSAALMAVHRLKARPSSSPITLRLICTRLCWIVPSRIKSALMRAS
jgi:hypothetical protein